MNCWYSIKGNTMNDDIWHTQFQKLSSWAESKGYEVLCKTNIADCIIFEDKEIFINSRCNKENQFYTLLHECGHLITDSKKKMFLDEHPIYPSQVLDGRREKSKAYKVCLLSEELSAWREGWRLAKRLKLYVNKRKYHLCMVDAVFSYVESVSA